MLRLLRFLGIMTLGVAAVVLFVRGMVMPATLGLGVVAVVVLQNKGHPARVNFNSISVKAIDNDTGIFLGIKRLFTASPAPTSTRREVHAAGGRYTRPRLAVVTTVASDITPGTSRRALQGQGTAIAAAA